MKHKKVILLFAYLLFFGFFTSASAMTDDEKNALIQQIIQQIAVLQGQLNQMVAQQNQQAGATNWCHTFTVGLGFANSGSDEVSALHTALQRENIYSSDDASTYGKDTALAVARFQAKYGIKQTGYVGPLTRTRLSSLYGCPPLRIIYPNGGETIHVGDTVRITWEATGLTSSDSLTISAYMPSNPYINVKNITTYASATQGYYDWVVANSNLPSASFPLSLRIKIKVNNKNISAGNASDFTINAITNSESSSIALRYPIGGEILYVGNFTRITWISKGLSSSDRVNISVYSPANPYSNVKIISSSIPATQGYYDWNILTSTLPSTSYPLSLKIKIEVVGKNLSDSSGSSFTINPTDNNQDSSSISLVYPGGGQVLYVGDSVRISWTSKGLSSTDKVNISVYSAANPYANVKVIGNSISAIQGYYDWSISTSTLPSTSYPLSLLVKIDVVNKSISSSSASSFTINSSNQGPAAISIVYPIGGETFIYHIKTGKGDSPRITWTTTGFTSSDVVSITVRLVSNPYLNVKTIASSVPATQGYYDWRISQSSVPVTGMSIYYIKVESIGRNVSASSNPFTVNIVNVTDQ